MALILIIEDEHIIAHDIKEIIEAEGHTCVTGISTYKDAIAAIEKFSPNLVLVDIILHSNYEGLKIGRYLHEKQTIPFVYITSLFDKNTRLEIKQTFPHGYLVKPFKPIDIITIVELTFHNFKHISVNLNKAICSEPVDYKPYQIRNAVNYINNNINQKICLEDLLVLTNWEKSHFCETFKKYMKVSPYNYILQVKIEKCIALVCTTNQSVYEIAFELGFNSYSSFSKMFKKHTGMTVEEFKRKSKMIKTIENQNKEF